jgi:predicted acetyltransferase
MTDRDLRALERLYPLYLHDLSDFTDYYQLDREGRWHPSHIEDWLSRDTSSSIVLRVDGVAAGFAWVAEQPFPHMDADRDYRLAEFFVARPFRRGGHGTWFAHDVISGFSGGWHLEVLLENAVALAFWRRVLERYGARETRRDDLGDYQLRFET